MKISTSETGLRPTKCFPSALGPINMKNSLTCSRDNIVIFIPTGTKFVDKKNSSTSTNAILFLSFRPNKIWWVSITQLTCTKQLTKLSAVVVVKSRRESRESEDTVRCKVVVRWWHCFLHSLTLVKIHGHPPSCKFSSTTPFYHQAHTVVAMFILMTFNGGRRVG